MSSQPPKEPQHRQPTTGSPAPTSTLSSRDVDRVAEAKKKLDDKKVNRSKKRRRINRVKAKKSLNALPSERQLKLKRALRDCPNEYRIICKRTGADMTEAKLDEDEDESDLDELRDESYVFEDACFPWEIYEISELGTFKTVEIVFWIQGALKHVNLIILKLLGYDDLAVKAGVASASQVTRRIQANLNPEDHGDYKASLISEMIKTDEHGKKWQAVARIQVFKRELLRSTHDQIKQQFDLAVDWNKQTQRRTYSTELRVYDRTWVGDLPQAKYATEGGEPEFKDMDVAICFGTNAWHLDIDNPTGTEVVYPIRDMTVNQHLNAAGPNHAGPGSLLARTLNVQSQIEHIFTSHYRHEINPDYIMMWHGQKNRKDQIARHHSGGDGGGDGGDDDNARK